MVHPPSNLGFAVLLLNKESRSVSESLGSFVLVFRGMLENYQMNEGSECTV